MPVQDQVGRKVLLTKPMLEEAIDHIRGAVMIAFPQGLPEWDLVRQALENTEELAGTSVSSASLLCGVIVMFMPSLCKNQQKQCLGPSHHRSAFPSMVPYLSCNLQDRSRPSRVVVRYALQNTEELSGISVRSTSL